jgi:hypothetical protein
VTTDNNKKFLLKEFTSFEYSDDDVKKITEKGGPMILNGILQKANTLNQNGRIYPHHILEREIRNYEKLIREKRAFGELDHANEPIVNMKNISHTIREIWMEGDVVYGKVEVLDTPCGKIIEAIIKAGCRPGISSRALGSLQRENNVNVVQDDLQIICWDFVSEPSTPSAFMQLAESRQYDESTIRQVFTKSDLVDRAVNDILSLKTK